MYGFKSTLLIILLIASFYVPASAQTSNVAYRLVSHFGDRIYAFDWSPDGSRIAVARSGGMVQILDATTLQVLVTLQHPQVSVLTWSPDGARLASGGWDDTIRIWDPNTGQSLAVIDSLVDRVTSIEWTSDGNRLIASGFEVGYRIWDASTYQFIKTFMGGQYEIDLSPDNTQLADARGGGVGIVNVETGETIAVLKGHQREVMSVAWSPDGTKLISGGYDRTVRLWDASTYQQLMVLQAHEDDVNRVAWSPDGRLIVSSGDETYVWDAVTGDRLATIDTFGGGVAWNPDGSQLVYYDEGGNVELVDTPPSSNCIATRADAPIRKLLP